MNSYKMLAIFSLLLSATIALASITGTISGIVTDPSGAVIPNAQVTAINTDTGQRSADWATGDQVSFLADR